MIIVHRSHEKISLDYPRQMVDIIKQTIDKLVRDFPQREQFTMKWVRHLLTNTDLALGLVLSIVLGSVVGLAMSHPLGHLILGSALGVIFLLTYMVSYSAGAIWMMGAQQGLIVVSVFVWCVILSSWLSPTPEMSLAVHWF
jgi:hypothetical protein